jgi:hypothetical protein
MLEMTISECPKFVAEAAKNQLYSNGLDLVLLYNLHNVIVSGDASDVVTPGIDIVLSRTLLSYNICSKAGSFQRATASRFVIAVISPVDPMLFVKSKSDAGC